MLQLEVQLQLLQAVNKTPAISQRELAKQLGFSLGKINSCIKDLLDKHWVTFRRFKNSSNKIAYRYQLTPQGFRQKEALTAAFLQAKHQQFESLAKEIDQLQQHFDKEN
ncbi:MarR family EPS-associated transcriptional regulator [bacterium]|nr:MarR family EPS-associated transcriptional regulator [bacterium]